MAGPPQCRWQRRPSASPSRLESAHGELPAGQLPHVAAWRDAYRAFGAKPQRIRNSLKALMRTASGLPRVNRLTDIYNAISLQHRMPLADRILPADPHRT
ncbi:hypothetical protein A6A27_37570 [Micromonospora sp. CB01531]|nr:hypothetical protein A6A27_37570 [Micromonospora sp. CB01531]